MQISKKKLRKLRDHKVSRKKKLKLLERLLSFSGVPQTRLLHQLVMDTMLADWLRASLVRRIGKIPSQESVQVLRCLTHDKLESVALRTDALYSLALLDDPLLHVDLASLLGDPDEDVLLRGEVGDKIGGLRVRRLEPLVTDILRRNEAHVHVLFWCLYACTGFETSPELLAVIEPYCHDVRLVDPALKGHVDGVIPLSMEAQWARDRLHGIFRAPEWEKGES